MKLTYTKATYTHRGLIIQKDINHTITHALIKYSETEPKNLKQLYTFINTYHPTYNL